MSARLIERHAVTDTSDIRTETFVWHEYDNGDQRVFIRTVWWDGETSITVGSPSRDYFRQFSNIRDYLTD